MTNPSPYNLDATSELLQKLIDDPILRREAARQHPGLFFAIYLLDDVRFPYPLAPFHREMFELAQRERLLVVMGARESAKSMILNRNHALWSIVGRPQKKMVLIVSRTQDQAKTHFANIADELKYNELLRRDLGPFENGEPSGNLVLTIKNFHARIKAVTVGQNILGMIHGAERPDLIICDDLDDPMLVKNRDERDRTFEWFTKQILPIGSDRSQILALGNLAHEDSFMMRLKRMIERGTIAGRFVAYPLQDDNGKPLWPGRFPTPESIEKFKKLRGITVADFEREYNLRLSHGGLWPGWPESETMKRLTRDAPHDEVAAFILKRIDEHPDDTSRSAHTSFMREYRISAPVIERDKYRLYMMAMEEYLRAHREEFAAAMDGSQPHRRDGNGMKSYL